MHSGNTKQRLGRVMLCTGMPVLVAQNFDVEGGIANGNRGTIQQIHYFADEQGIQYIKICVVHIQEYVPECSHA